LGTEIDINRLAFLVDAGKQIVQAAERVPLGSLAHSIAKGKGCTILLCPMDQQDHVCVGEEELVSLYSRWNDNHREYYIFYNAVPEEPTFRSLRIRYAIAHKLAHIFLEHPLLDGQATPKQEIEAHILSAVIVLLHGPPVRRLTPNQGEFDSLINQLGFDVAHKDVLLQAFTRVQAMTVTSPATNESWYSDLRDQHAADLSPPDWTRQVQLVAQSLSRYFEDETSRLSVAKQADERIMRALNQITG
jgi:hypothetical protein